MAQRTRPLTDDSAPDTATVYERAKPEKEAGMGRLDNNADATPTPCPDSVEKAVSNKQVPEHQINAEDIVDGRDKRSLD